ncbi:4Fe-4S binding protein [Candidatus Magnetomonas plexicatena]|uniref:4Fe-4S binding protein n=1 Tax=Candidatus Magnetomonas plexicatena TaxID=2552947 RepID=UPI0011050F39|nr:4Fe-4S binding protein [Nitrospirales bacterium LBB_01]
MKNMGISCLTLNKRYFIIFISAVLFLPPVSLIPQLAMEPNMCGQVCPKLFLIIPKGGDILGKMWANVKAMWFGASLVASILTVTFFFGRLWCGHICPVGGLPELTGRFIPRWLKINFSWMNAPAFRYGYFAIFILASVLGVGSIACKLCNFRVIPFLTGAPFEGAYVAYLSSSMGIAGIATVLVTGVLAKGGRAYCNLLCPVGAVDGFINLIGTRFGFNKKIITDKSQCNGCGNCVKACIVWARKLDEQGKAETNRLSCMTCLKCTYVCSEGAIRYGRDNV